MANLELVKSAPKADPIRVMTDALTESARRTEASNKALVEAVKGIVMKASDVNVAAPQVKLQMPESKKPLKWTFTMVRNAEGLLESITAVAG